MQDISERYLTTIIYLIALQAALRLDIHAPMLEAVLSSELSLFAKFRRYPPKGNMQSYSPPPEKGKEETSGLNAPSICCERGRRIKRRARKKENQTTLTTPRRRAVSNIVEIRPYPRDDGRIFSHRAEDPGC